MQQTKENKLGTQPIGSLLLRMSLPIVLSMMVQALYNVVDSIFVAQISEDALTAVSLVFPIQNLMIAFAVGTSVGVGSLISRRLGEKNPESANRAAANGLFLAVLNWLLFALVGLLFSRAFFASYTGSENGAEIAAMGAEYMGIVTIASLGLFMSVCLERLLQSTGLSMFSMVSQMVGAVVNIILDPILIFGYLGAPEMGVAGAAVATIIGQFCAMGVGIAANALRNRDIRVKLRGFRPSAKTIKHIYQVGLPSIIMQSIGSVMTYCMNLILISFGTTPVSVFGVYFKLQSFVFMPVLGFNNGMVPIVAYNYGARRPDRIKKTIRLALYICFGMMVAGMVAFWLIPDKLLMLFDAQDNMMAIGTRALRVISLSFPMAAVSIVFVGFFQAIGAGIYSMLVSMVRQLVFLLPVAWVLARINGLDSLWFAFPVAEIAALLLTIWFFRRTWKKLITNGIQK